MHALEISRFGLITSLDQCSDATAEHSLLTEEIGLGLFFEGCTQYTGTSAANSTGVGQCERLSITAGILKNGEESGYANTLNIEAAHHVSGTLGSDHRHIHISG